MVMCKTTGSMVDAAEASEMTDDIMSEWGPLGNDYCN